MSSKRSTRNIAIELLALALVACGPGKPPAAEASGSETGGSTSTTSDATSEPTGGSLSMPAMSTTDVSAGCFESLTNGAVDDDLTPREPIGCSPVSTLPCTAPVGCPNGQCGSHVSPLDENGCPRATCTADDDCLTGEVCNLNESLPDFDEFGGSVSCSDAMGFCECVLIDEPATGVCMPAVIIDALATHCDALADMSACNRYDVGSPRYCRWTPTQLFCADACAEPVDSAACIYFSYVGDGCAGDCAVGDGFGYSRPRGSGSETFVNNSCGDEPTLWAHCFDAPTDACACICSDM
jgi:hypothetical protein